MYITLLHYYIIDILLNNMMFEGFILIIRCPNLWLIGINFETKEKLLSLFDIHVNNQ